MNPVVYHIVSGQAFFTGIILIVLAAIASTRQERFARPVTALGFAIGMIAVIASSTALPYWLYGLAGGASLCWIASRFRPAWRSRTAVAMIIAWGLAAGMEAPYHLSPSLEPGTDRVLAIIGDSVTAGLGSDDPSQTWPTLLARKLDLEIQDISHVGETAGSALKRVQSHEVSAPVVVVEIGGNDILGSTSPEQFAHDLDALLEHLAAPSRQVVMFELPLPPFFHAYGWAQRTLAAKHGVLLIPKRVFLSVIAGNESTLDSIHLSQAGHEEMARQVGRVLEPAFRATQAPR
ncbi:acyl-CoA thioesterase [bacterium]|nr:acyl-CoA thioesterase [bacterium]